MNRALLSYDVASIHRYVFASDGLREVRGGSSLLDHVNRKLLGEAVKMIDNSAVAVFAGGGSGLLEVASEKIEAATRALHRQLRDSTGSATLHTATIECGASGFSGLFGLLQSRLWLAKMRNPERLAAVSHSLMRTCDTCGDYYATSPDADRSEEMACRACALKIEEDRAIKKSLSDKRLEWRGLWGRVAPSLPADLRLEEYTVPEDLDHLCPNRQDLALLYADGDGMGALFENCGSLDDVKKRSQGVEIAMQEALVSGLTNLLRRHGASRLLPFDIFLLGGDDLVMGLQARYAFPLALDLVNQFPIHAKSRTGNDLTLSVGLAVAHSHYPMRSLLDLSVGALKYAKRERFLRGRRGDKAGQGMINHIVVGNLSHANFQEYMRSELTAETGRGVLRRTLRPYTSSELETLMGVAKELADLPRTKLELLRASAFLDVDQGIFEGLGALIRMRDNDRKKVRACIGRIRGRRHDEFPWMKSNREYVNPWADIAELADFAGGWESR